MSIANLQVFQKTLETVRTEVQAQNVNAFNAATRGGFALQNGDNPGDYAQIAKYAKISGLVQNRDIDGTDAITPTTSSRIVERSVKCGYLVRHDLDSAAATWLGTDGEIAAALAQQIVEDRIAVILNNGIAAFLAATTTVAASALHYDHGSVAPTWAGLQTACQKMGDRQGSIVCWIMHSAHWNALYGQGLSGTNTLFRFNDGSLTVMADPMGRPFIITDSSHLVSSSDYYALGLTQQAILAVMNNSEDRTSIVSSNSLENISNIYGLDGSYNLGLKGFQWDSSNGGNSPSDAAIATGALWDKIATSHKDCAGVVYQSHLTA
jgi:hypothetical protein